MSALRRWTAAEDAVVRAEHPKGGPRRVASMLEGRTVDACARRAVRLHVHMGRKRYGRGNGWTPEEDAILARLWPSHNSREIIEMGVLPGRNARSMASRAAYTGVRRIPKGSRAGAVSDADGLLVLPPARHLWTALEDRLVLAAMELRPGGLTPHQCDALAAIVSVGSVRVNRHDVAAHVAELYERMGTGRGVAA